MPLIPWAILQLDTIKAVIHDLGLAHLTSRTARKNDLVKLLYSIDIEGLSPVRKRLQATAARDAFSSNYLPEETPELEYAGPGPSTSSASTPASARVRPIVEIPVHIPIFPPSDEDEDEVPVRVSRRSRPPRTRASLKGKARARSSPSSDSEDDPENSSLPPPRPSRPASSTGTSLSRIEPPTKKTRRGRPPLATTTTTTTTTTSTSVSARRAVPPSRKRARAEPAPVSTLPPIDLSKIPPPSYAILYEQLHNISKPRRTPWPRLNPHETFAGVDVPPRKGKRKRLREEEDAEDAEGEGDEEQERAREEEGERNGGASSRRIVSEAAHSVNGSEEFGGAARGWGTRGTSTGTGTGTGTGTAASTTGSVTRRMEAVVVSSFKTLKAKTATSGHRRKTIVMSDDEIEFWV